MSASTKIIIIIVLFFLILASALFSGAETAYSSVSRVKIEKSANSGKRSGKLIMKHYKSFGWTLATILIANNLVNVLASALTTYLFASMFSSGLATIMATFVMTPIIVLFGEITPKLMAKKYSFGYLKKVVYLMEFLNWLFFPLTFMLKKLALNAKVTNSEDELKTYLKIASSEGVLEKREATLAANALDLDSKQVSRVYTRKKNVAYVNSDDSLAVVKHIFEETGYSRLPVKNSKGRFIGVVLLKDIIFKEDGKAKEFAIDIPYVSKNMIIPRVLEQLRISTSHIAFVTENLKAKKVIGIITVEDIIEELIGEIYDEHDSSYSVNEIALHKFRVNGDIDMKELEKELEYEFDESENKTVKQWISSRINRNFKKELEYTYKDKIKFKVISNKKGESSVIEVIQK